MCKTVSLLRRTFNTINILCNKMYYTTDYINIIFKSMEKSTQHMLVFIRLIRHLKTLRG